ncbi:ABC transporter ATP-binding protein [Naasia sp. SYSU D00057]|uniref:ABC transporter ATP-binding protein n=1 Tax=Naasia sp. SYSU D00057 TaxID=2817380 RepID=UPI001B302FDF|nr:ABC transporter ATP-binding protein [Naasia sp. SYSU D00057]
MAGRLELYRIRARDVLVVVALGLLQVAVLVLYVILIPTVIAAMVPVTVGEAARVAWQNALLEAVLIAALALLQGLLFSIEFSFRERIGYRIVRDLRMRMYGHLQGMTPRQMMGRARGGLLLRFLGDLSMTRLWISRGILGGINAGIVIVGSLTVLSLFNAWMTAGIVAVLCVGAAASLSVGRAMRQATRVMRLRRSLVMSNLDEQINAHSVVQVFGRLGGEYSRLSRQNDALTAALIRVAVLRGRLRGLSSAFAMIAVAAVLVTGLLETRRGAATVGLVVAFVVVARQLAGPVRRLGLAHDYWHRAQVSQGKIREYLRSSSRHLDDVSQGSLRVRRGEIRFESVSVPGALNDFTLTVEPGELVAITGPGGAGKSTVLNLVARLVEPASGSITVDGQPLDQVSIRSVARHIGVLAPELPLMRGSLRRNLTYRDPDAPPEEVERIVDSTGLRDVVDGLPQGLDAWLTERGNNLSFSQRQHIAFGRAVMGDPQILLLDEPTLGLAPSAKEAVHRVIARHQGTILVATHDPDEIALADRVVVLKDGMVAAVLSGDECRDQMWGAQQAGFSWTPGELTEVRT